MEFLAVCLITILFGHREGVFDSKKMPSFKKNLIQKINQLNDHILPWLYRGSFISLILYLYGFNIWLLFAFAGLFSIFFRFTLNKKRNAKWDYISISNWYDSFFCWVSTKYGGKLAYIVELSVFLIITLKHFMII